MTIVIVDDELAIRKIIQQLFEDEGYDVLCLEDGEQALERLEWGADQCVVLLDLFMPRLSGEDLLLHIAQNKPALFDRHRFVILSGIGLKLPATLEAITRDRQICVIAKPFVLDTLVAVVAQLARELSEGLASA